MPLLDYMFRQPIFTTTGAAAAKKMPSKQMVVVLLERLREAGFLKVVREAAGANPQVLALAEPVKPLRGQESGPMNP